MTPLRGSLTLQGDRMIVTEIQSRSQPVKLTQKEVDKLNMKQQAEYAADCFLYDEHVAGLKQYTAIGFPSSSVGEVEYVTGWQMKSFEDDCWIDCTEEVYKRRGTMSRRIVAIPATAPIGKPEESEVVNHAYNKTYPSEVVYHSDKNFLVRLKAMIERTLKHLDIKVSREKLGQLMEIIGNEAEDCLFESQLSPADSSEQDENWKDVISFILTRKIKSSMNPYIRELKQSYTITRRP